jgi:ATP-binding cassette subfamily C protein
VIDRLQDSLRPARAFALTFWAHGPTKILRYGGVLGLDSLTRGFGILMLVPILAAAGIGGGEEVGTGPLKVVAHFLFKILGIPRELFWVLAAYLGLMIFRELLSRTQSIMAQELELGFVRGLRERLYEALVHAEWLFLARRRGSDFMQVLTTDLERAGTAAFYGIRIVSGGVMGFVYLALAVWVSPWLTGATALAAGMLFLIFRRSMKKAHEHGVALTRHQNQMFGAVTDELGARTEREERAVP